MNFSLEYGSIAKAVEVGKLAKEQLYCVIFCANLTLIEQPVGAPGKA